MTDDVDALISTLSRPPFSGKAGNKALREALGWSGDEDRYWQAHARAIDSGKVVPGRGKGGSVRLLSVDRNSEEDRSEAQPLDEELLNDEPQKEASLYDGGLSVIKNGWVKSATYDSFVAEITAAKGRAATGGKWTRPDISLLAIKAFPYLPSRQFDIVTFEIKPKGQTTVEGVFEALSHQQFATRSYVIFHLDSADADQFDKHQNAPRILGTARKHGIGVILATDISDFETWDEIIEANRGSPDPEQANRFIATCFSESTKDEVIKWHK